MAADHRVQVTRIHVQAAEDEHERTHTSSSASPWSSRPFARPSRLQSTAMLAGFLLLTMQLMPLTALAAGPRLMSAEYEVRTLNLGTVQRSTSGEAFDTPYELAWNRYEFAAIDLIFDQPLYITNGAAILAASRGGAAGDHGQPSSPHRTNHTHLPALEGSIVMKCSSSPDPAETAEQQFSLSNAWPGTAESNIATEYWSSPTPHLLPLYSPHNTLKSDLVQLFDRRVDQVKSTQATSLFAATTGQDAETLASVVGRPNVLSLMLMLSFETEELYRAFLAADSDENPLSQCEITYVSALERAHSTRNDTRSSTSSSSSRVSGLTNFRGSEISFTSSPLRTRLRGKARARVQERSLVRVQEGLEEDFEDEKARELESQRRSDAEMKEEQLYAQSPLDAPKPMAAAGSKSSESSSSLALRDSFEDDPFNNILLDVSSGVGFVQLILKPICNGVLKPATKGTNDLLLDDIMTELGNNLFDSVVDEVSPDVNIMLGTALQTSLSNILQDSLSYAITKTMTQVITADVAPYVIDRLIKNLPGPLHTIIQAILEKKIPDRLERTMPVILSRVLSVTLTHSLTRSIPHVVVPTVSHSLGLGHAGSFSRPKYYYEVCMQCYLQSIGKIPPVRMAPPDMNPDGYDSGIGSGGVRAGSECGACPTSTYSMYYGIYHAAYYTDFYSEYYAEYYSQAMQMADGALYSDAGAAHGRTEGDAPAAGGDGVAGGGDDAAGGDAAGGDAGGDAGGGDE